MKVLVLGAGGMAGHVVAGYLKQHCVQVDTVSRANAFDDYTYLIDVTAPDALTEFLRRRKYDAVINCIGVLVGQAETSKDLAAYLNSYLPHHLERIYASTDTRLIHLSTDCVFSGDSPPYREDSPHDGRLFYDRSKSLGEVINGKDLTFRMSIIGPDRNANGVGLFNWFLQQQGEVAGYTAAIWNGVSTVELARAIHQALEQDLRGVYQLVPHESISKFALLTLIRDRFGLGGINVIPTDTPKIDKTLANTRNDFDFAVNDYEQMVTAIRDWIRDHKSDYPHYV